MPNNEPRLTSLSHGGGCGCKIAPTVLSEILKGTLQMPIPKELMVGIATADDAAVYKIKLDNFLVDWDCFLSEFLKVTDIIGHTTSDSEIQAVKILYYQWRTTILEHADIATFKKDIGFFDE